MKKKSKKYEILSKEENYLLKTYYYYVNVKIREALEKITLHQGEIVDEKM